VRALTLASLNLSVPCAASYAASAIENPTSDLPAPISLRLSTDPPVTSAVACRPGTCLDRTAAMPPPSGVIDAPGASGGDRDAILRERGHRERNRNETRAERAKGDAHHASSKDRFPAALVRPRIPGTVFASCPAPLLQWADSTGTGVRASAAVMREQRGGGRPFQRRLAQPETRRACDRGSSCASVRPIVRNASASHGTSCSSKQPHLEALRAGTEVGAGEAARGNIM